MWSALVEEFIVIGDPPPPPGSEALVHYTWEEAEALRNASPEHVIAAHRVKKAFKGEVRPCASGSRPSRFLSDGLKGQ